MIVLEYKVLLKDDHEWLSAAEAISSANWKAAKYLADKMDTGGFSDWEGVVIAKDDERLVGFCSFVKKDIIESIEYSPYIAIVYVEPNYRGHHISQKLVSIAENQLKKLGFKSIYIVTQHEGLYEKSGYKQIDSANDKFGRLMRILKKNI